MSVAVAEGSSFLSECSGDSSVLLDLSAMFPSLDHEVIVTVLQAHEGRVEAVVDYLMSVVGGGGEEEEGEDEELQGPFSDDIGGPPEIVPSFLQEPEGDDRSLTESLDIGGPPEIVPSFLQEPEGDDRSLTESLDPLPTYEQACMPIELGPPPYICIAHDASSPAPQPVLNRNPSCQSIREHCVPGQQETQISREHRLPRGTQLPTQNSHQAEAGSTPSQHQQLRSQGRRGKLRKLAHKLGRRRSSDYKVDQEKGPSPPLPYLRLLDDDELEDGSGTQ